MIGKTVSHYTILEKLGEGGMGVVYKAQDTKLDRTVALKFLPPELTSDADAKQRFIHEARAASGLDHPNICTIYEIAEADDRLFISMAYIEGQTLKDRIKTGPLGIEEAGGVALQVAAGLQEAHEKGIIHRDIKPANIMIAAKGRAKIMDFGLAKSGDIPDLTQAGTTLGTVAYMSPEQTRGDEVDPRTDVWSLGVVLYETVTGRRPFRGDYEQAVVYSILNEDPEPLSDSLETEGTGLGDIIERCLKKDPAERYPTAADLMEDLRPIAQGAPVSSTTIGVRAGEFRTARRGAWWAWIGLIAVIAAAAAIVLPRYLPTAREEPVEERKMLAVLPFENLGSPEDEYFADGMTEEVTARLAGIRDLGVIARTSAMQYKDTDKVIPVIGSELGVGYILEGTIRWQRMSDGKSQVRVTPQLIRVSDATHLWAHVYQMDISDIFQVQSDIAGKVAEALGIALLGPERRAVEVKPTENLQAYDYYLRAQDYSNRSYGSDDQRISREMCDKAIALDSTFAQAWALKSLVQSQMYWFDQERTDEARDVARISAERSLRLDPGSPEAHLAMGHYYYWCLLDYDTALEEFSEAREIQPSNAAIYSAIAYVQRRQGNFDGALVNLEKSLELDPLSWLRTYEIAETYTAVRRYEDGARYLDRAIALRPDWALPYGWKAYLYLRWTGDTARAHAILDSIPGPAEDSAELLGFIKFQLDWMDGKYEDALKRLSLQTDVTTENHYLVYPKTSLQALMYGHLGRKDLEFAYYDSARVYLEARIENRPDDARLHSTLGLVYAGLGRKQDAIREGRLAVDLLPLSRDASRAPYNMIQLAQTYSIVGEYDLALDQLEYLLTIPASISAAQLRVEPRWAPLRGHERFEKLIAGGNSTR